MKVYLFLATGFQESEALANVTICHRADIEIQTVSITGDKLVVSANGVPVVADSLLEECDFSDAAMLIMPGGMPGSSNLRDCKALQEVILKHHAAGKPLAAICAAPIVYGNLGLLDGVKATCYPGFENELKGAVITGQTVTTDGLFITGHGPGASFDFGLAIVEYLKGKELVEKVKASMMWPY